MTLLKQLETKLGIQSPEDWYRFKRSDVIQHGGVNLLHQYSNSITQMLSSLYPDVPWVMTK